MADQHAHTADDRRPSQGANGGESEPTDLEAALRELQALKVKHGALLNETKSAKKARDALVEKLKGWTEIEEEHGIEPAAAKALFARQQEAELGAARDKGEIDKLLADRDRVHQREMAKLREQMQAEADINNAVMLEAELRAELAKWVEPRLLKGAFHLHRHRISMIDDPSAPHGRRPVAAIGDDIWPIADYIKNWAETDDEAEAYLQQSLARGGGAGGNANPRLRFKARSEMTDSEKSAYIRQHGKPEYDKLPWKHT